LRWGKSEPPRWLSQEVSISLPFDLKGVAQDLVGGARRQEVWLAFAADEIQNRYRRSVVGLLWIVISYLIWVFGLAVFFGAFADLNEKTFVVYIAFGFAIFNFLLSNIMDGCTVFTTNSGWVKSASLPYSIYVFKSVARSLFPFLIQMITAFVIAALFLGWRPTGAVVLALPALLVAIATAVPLQYVLGLLCARLRDIGHFIQAVSRILLFASPIMWVYEEAGGLRRTIADYNPMTAYIEIFRDPLMGTPLVMEQYLIALGSCAVMWIACLLVGGVMRKKLPFWV
jgi:ABC-type polysaccharide/polyol phosphate export permease